MSSFHQQVRRTIKRHGLCPPGSRVLAAVSGGSDSVALCLLLRELAPFMQFELVGLAHFNHGLRATAARDEQFSSALASRLALPLEVGSGDVRAIAAAERRSLEDAARRARYAFLEQAASARGADRIAVGHTLDDQAETLLLKLVRGAGTTGLGSIYPARNRVVRPLLDVSRGELRDYLRAAGETWVEDETNADLSNPRNRVRHVLLPRMEETFGPSVRPALARAAGLLGEDARWLDALAEEALARMATPIEGGLALDAEQLAAAPGPVARRVVLLALRSQAAGKEVVLEHVRSAFDVLEGVSAGADLPGCRVELRGQKLVLLQ